MLPYPLRLSKEEITAVFRQGKRVYSPHFQCVFLPDKTTHANRWLIRIPARLVKKATARNRIKRLLRESIKEQHGSFLSGSYVVLLSRSFAAPPTLVDIKKELEELGASVDNEKSSR